MIPDTRSDVELNTIIARWLGWHCLTTHYGKVMGYSPESKPPFDICCWHYVPNYCRDLNAVHEAEKNLKGDEDIEYVDAIFFYSGINRYFYMGAVPEAFPADRQRTVICSTARQRAEALVSVIESLR